MLTSASENYVANVDIRFIIFFVFLGITDVDIRFIPFRNFFCFFILRMLTSASENYVADIDIRFIIFCVFI